MHPSNMNLTLNKDRRLIAFIYVLLINSSTFVTGFNHDNPGLDCTNVKDCECSQGTEIEVSCPKNHTNITVRVESQRVEIECYVTSDDKIYSFLPDLKIGNTNIVKFKWCPMPIGASIKGILDKLGIQGAQTLTLSSKSDISLVRQQLYGLDTIRNLRINGPVSHLPDDLFNDLVNITSLGLFSSKVHLPAQIFQNLRELELLELGSNNLSQLEEGVFRNQYKLKGLNLLSNNLKNLTKNAFAGASTVTDLDISSNNIETLQSDVFETLTNLTNINLSGNHFVELPEGIFRANKQLVKVRLLNNRVDLKALPNGFLANLQHLNEVLIRCNVKTLPGNLFANSPNLRNLTLEWNALETLPVQIFDSQVELLDLNLSNNNLTTLPDFLFNNTYKLVALRLSHNQLQEIPENLFIHLINLEQLYLDNNQLHRIHRNVFYNTRVLQILNLENNQLDFDRFVPNKDSMARQLIFTRTTPFQNMHKLKKILLRNNSITKFLDDWKTNNAELELLDLSYNHIQQLDLMVLTVIWSRSITINLSNNRIERITNDDFAYNIIRFDMEKQAEKIINERPNIQWKWILNNNPFHCDCTILQFVKLLRGNINVKQYLKLINDELKCTVPAKLINQSVSQIEPNNLLCPLDSPNTTEKYCPAKCDCWVRKNDETIIFNCSNARLTEVPLLPKISTRTLSSLQHYELNIENNFITELPVSSMEGYDNVVKINARNNSIRFLTVRNLPKNLSMLDISRNKLRTLNTDILQRLNETGTLKKLIIEGNPWKCECGSDFLKYIRSHSEKVDYRNITCHDGVLVRDKNEECPMDKALLILGCVLIALLGFFIGAVIALYYKYQQEVKVWLFAHNLCLWFVTEEELDKDKKYDAFISFSHKDEDFVTEQLVPELENGPHPFKICLHFRDWVVGEFIPNQISKSVEDSRRTIVVLTPNFIESIWGRMEFRAAHKNALSEGRSRVIVIIYGEIGDIDKLDPELKVYLRTNTYVKWGDPWFFDKLRYAMPHPTNFKSKGLIKSTMKSSIDDKLELIKPTAVTPPLTTPPAEQAHQNPLIGKLNIPNGRYHSNGLNGINGLNGHVNGAFIINTNAKQSDV